MLISDLKNSNITLLSSHFATQLIEWYHHHHRILPWRETKDPYKIWLSEIILQQTRVAQGLPYYQRFIEKYPTVYDLAMDNETAVLRMWQGLGYYTRARNLHACARIVVNQFQGKFPNNYKALLRLPGIGTYTAAAIASIAFKEVVPVIDGNVYRVLSRVFGIDIPINNSKGKHIFKELAQALVSKTFPDIYNQAIMEFGAIQCAPLKPLCATCIFKIDCSAFLTAKQNQLPVKEPKTKIKERFFHYLVIQLEDELLMKIRKPGDIWTGLYDFYLIEDSELRKFEQLEDDLVDLIKRHRLHIEENSKVYKHILTHRILYVSFFRIIATENFVADAKILFKNSPIHTFQIQTTKSLPKPKLICTFLEEYLYI